MLIITQSYNLVFYFLILMWNVSSYKCKRMYHHMDGMSTWNIGHYPQSAYIVKIPRNNITITIIYVFQCLQTFTKNLIYMVGLFNSI